MSSSHETFVERKTLVLGGGGIVESVWDGDVALTRASLVVPAATPQHMRVIKAAPPRLHACASTAPISEALSCQDTIPLKCPNRLKNEEGVNQPARFFVCLLESYFLLVRAHRS